MNSKAKPKTAEVLLETLQHCFRMREHIVKQQLGGRVSLVDMHAVISEWWGRKDCPACRHFAHCSGCPLNVYRRCCDGLWRRIEGPRTWGEFLPAMDRVIVFITEKYVEARAKE